MLKPTVLTLPLVAVGILVLAGCPAASTPTDAPAPPAADGQKSVPTKSTADKPVKPDVTSAGQPDTAAGPAKETAAGKPAEPSEPAPSTEKTAAPPQAGGAEGPSAAQPAPTKAVSTTAGKPEEPAEPASSAAEPAGPGETVAATPTVRKYALPPKQPWYPNPLRPETNETPATGKKATTTAPPPSAAKTKNTATSPAGSDAERPPFDPIKVNGPIFVGWKRPRLALVISGRIAGYLEPCGCAGLDRQKGGISRRSTVISQLKKDGWPVVALDLGGLVNRYGRQAELKFHTTASALRAMGYCAVGFGPDDLRLTAGELVAETTDPDIAQSPFVSANVGLMGMDSDLVARCRVIEAAGLKIGVTAILGKQYQKSVSNDDVAFADPQAALVAVLPKLKAQCDYLVLLSYATPEESTALAKRFPEFDVVVTAGGLDEPPEKEVRLGGPKNTMLISVGSKGMNVIVLGLYNSPTTWRYQRVPLDSRFEASPPMKQLMAAYQDQLRELGFTNLVAPAIPHPQTSATDKLLGRFSNSDRCESCHEISFDIWRKSKHSRAYQSLAKADPPRQYDPECIGCHVVGWGRDTQTQEPIPYATGFRSHERTRGLENVGCDSCHGPGTAHVVAELGKDEALKIRLRPSVRITKDEALKKHFCQTCHDLDNSPEFKFETYWPKVEHYEKLDEEELLDGPKKTAAASDE